MGYHKKQINKGVLGLPSKIQEELDELVDAVEQNNKILAMCECADIYGALEAVAKSLNINMEDLKKMSDATKSAFIEGSRK